MIFFFHALFKSKATFPRRLLAGFPLNSTMQNLLIQYQFSSVTQSCPTLCDPMNCSMSDLPVHHQLLSLPKLMSIESVMPSNHLICCPPLLLLPSIFPASGSLLMSQLFASGGQRIGASASASVLPVNIQG